MIFQYFMTKYVDKEAHLMTNFINKMLKFKLKDELRSLHTLCMWSQVFVNFLCTSEQVGLPKTF
uniref:Uncharacterized protein n=1 Tax=Anguilla anguilla TaxID=7936 RepID=A0A0E9XD38_ANGAN